MKQKDPQKLGLTVKLDREKDQALIAYVESLLIDRVTVSDVMYHALKEYAVNRGQPVQTSQEAMMGMILDYMVRLEGYILSLLEQIKRGGFAPHQAPPERPSGISDLAKANLRKGIIREGLGSVKRSTGGEDD